MQDGDVNETQGDESLHAEFVGGGPGGLVLSDDVLPERIPIIPLQQRPVFPGTTMPLEISDVRLQSAVEFLKKSASKYVGVVLAKEYNQEAPLESELHDMGTVLRILKMGGGSAEGQEDGPVHLLFHGVRRFRLQEKVPHDSALIWKVEYFYDPEGPEIKKDEELQAYVMAVINSVKELLTLNPLFMEQLKMLVANLSHDKPGLIFDLIASMTTSSGEKLQEVLATIPLQPRAERLLSILQEELSIFQLQQKIKKSIEERISKQQHEYFLREQLKEIKKELGLEKDEKSQEIERFKERIENEELTVPEEARKRIEEELNKLSVLEPASPEYGVTRNYLDWLTVLPWGKFTKDHYDIAAAREVLDRDHFGLDDVKDRILEFISVGKKTGSLSGSILLLVGPPGVGKTSIGRSVAEALGRKFYRFSLGGMRDEAEIKGHRRTYIGAMPGKFVQALKTVESANPVIMLDEVDKIGASFRGDPASALLEVLDPEQNNSFLDHYLDVPFDLSRVMFIATANQLDTIPGPLLDRMELLKLSGYILREKREIAKRYLIPRALEEHGLSENDVTISDETLNAVVENYAREAGVRNLENKIKKIMRKLTLQHAEGESAPRTITPENLDDYLGQPPIKNEVRYDRDVPGVVSGLAWTSMGGATLYIEAQGVKTGKGGFKQTGQLGDVMKESSEIAFSYARSFLRKQGGHGDYFDDHFVHLHVPAGATPKDGPSAGITMALALYSLATNRPVPRNLAMTGEISLIGKVMPIGGVKEKIIAARRVGIDRVILPEDNRNDYEDLPDHLREGMHVEYASYFDDVLKIAYSEVKNEAEPPAVERAGVAQPLRDQERKRDDW